MTIINKQHIISISELDKFGTDFYNKALIAAKLSSPVKRRVESENNIGYIGSIDESRSLLEDLYNKSHDVPES